MKVLSLGSPWAGFKTLGTLSGWQKPINFRCFNLNFELQFLNLKKTEQIILRAEGKIKETDK